MDDAKRVRPNRGDLGLLVIAMCAMGVLAVALLSVAATEALQEAEKPVDGVDRAGAMSEQSRLDMTSAYDPNAPSLLTTGGASTLPDGTSVYLDPTTHALVVQKGESLRLDPQDQGL